MSERNSVFYDLWSISSVTNTDVVFCREYRNVIIDVFASATANLTFKVMWGISAWTNQTPPDIWAVASNTNRYASIESIDKEDWTIIDWDTWITYTWVSDWVHHYVVNSDGLDWMWLKVTARTGWTVDFKVRLYNNQ